MPLLLQHTVGASHSLIHSFIHSWIIGHWLVGNVVVDIRSIDSNANIFAYSGARENKKNTNAETISSLLEASVESSAIHRHTATTSHPRNPYIPKLFSKMVSLKLQKRLAASELSCGQRKVWLDPNEVTDISMANSSTSLSLPLVDVYMHM